MKRISIAIVCMLFLVMACGLGMAVGEQQTMRFAAVPSVPGQGVTSAASESVPQEQTMVPSFAEVKAILALRCTLCHSGAQPAAGLRLESYAHLMSGSAKGPVVIPRDPAGSELVRRIRGTSSPRMPLSGPPWLSEKEIALIEGWIAAGALADGDSSTPSGGAESAAPASKTEQKAVIYSDVSPLFGRYCVKCHMDNGVMGSPPEGLRLNSYESIFSSQERALVIPGLPDASELLRRIRGQSLPRMPYDGPPYLEEMDVGLITAWILQGARDSNGDKRPLPEGAEVRLGGQLTGQWALDGMPLTVDDNTRFKKDPKPGDYAEVRGTVEKNGQIRATRITAR